MYFTFNSERKWFREGIKDILSVLITILLGGTSLLTFGAWDSMAIFLSAILLIFILVRLNRAFYYFTLRNRYYLILENHSISIFRGNIFPRKVIHFESVEKVVQVNDLIVFKLENGKEEPVFTDWLSSEDVFKLKNALKYEFGKRAIAI